MTTARRLITGSLWNLAAVVFNQGSTLIVSVVLARVLSQQTFGEYAMVQTTLTTIATLSQLATGYTASKYIAEYRTIDRKRAGRVLAVCMATSLATAVTAALFLFGVASTLADKAMNAPHLSSTVSLGAGFVFFSVINGYQMGALSGLEAYRALARAGIISGLSTVATTVLGALYAGLDGAVFGLGASAMVRCGTHAIYLRIHSRSSGIVPQYARAWAREKTAILNFALPAAIAGYYSLPMIWIASAILVNQTRGYEQMALYTAANSVRIAVLFLPNVVNSVGLSVLNNEKSRSGSGYFYRTFKSNVAVIFAISFVVASAMYFLGPFILRIYGDNFDEARPILHVLLVVAVIESTSIALYQLIQSRAKLWRSLVALNVPRETTLVVSAYSLIDAYGGLGLALSQAIASIVGLLLTVYLVVWLMSEES